MDASGKKPRKAPLTVIVVAGAGARGAFEAAAMAELLPACCPDGLGNTILLGTSAGAINVALWASRLQPNKALGTVGEKVKDVWRGINRHAVYEVPLDGYAKTGGAALTDAGHTVVDQVNDVTAGLWSAATGWIPKLPLLPSANQVVQFASGLVRNGADAVFGAADVVLGHPLERTGALLDTSPLRRTAHDAVDFDALRANIAEGRLGGVGLVATSCPMDASGGRSRVFLQLNERFAIPQGEPDSSIDYVSTPLLDVSHVLASAAIPIVFPPVKIDAPEAYAGWYTDGGVRLNAPIEPAIKLNAERIIVISSHATTYPKTLAAQIRPQIIDIGAQAVHSVLADAMIEDLRALKRINKMVEDAGAGVLKTESGRPYRKIDLTEVAPANGALSARAEKVAQEVTAATDRALLRFFARFSGGTGRNELLSYLLFEPAYFEKQFALGKKCALQAIGKLRKVA